MAPSSDTASNSAQTTAAKPTERPVLVGIDGSDSSLEAASWAGRLAQKLGTSVHLVHSTVTTGSFLADASVVAIRAAATADQYAAAEKVLTLAQQALEHDAPGLAVTTEIVSEPADVALILRSKAAQFAVIGCEDVSPAAALLLGSTSLTLATRAGCPVVAWRGRRAPGSAPVVVGVDGSRAGTAALAGAFAFADAFGAPLTAVHSWTTTMPPDHAALPYLIDWDAVELAEQSVLSDAVGPWAQRYPAVKVSYVVELNKPGRALLDHSEGAQLVVVGTHRGNAISAVLLGSTTLNLLHHSKIPVLVCRSDEAP